MKKLLIIGVLALTPIFIQGCSKQTSDGTSNRDIVARYVENNEENSENAEIYRQLAEVIINRNSDKNKIVDYTEASKESTTKSGQNTKSKGNVKVSEIDNFTPGKQKELADTDDIPCDFALEAGLYVAGRDILTGQYRIGFTTQNHGMYCIELHNGQQVQPGSMSEDYNMYWYNCEFTKDLLVKVDKKAYFKTIVPGSKDSDYDMSDEYYEDMSEVELLWLAAADKKPEVSISDAKIIKKTSNDCYVMQYTGGMVLAEFSNADGIESESEISFNGRIIGHEVVGQKNLAKIKVPEGNWK